MGMYNMWRLELCSLLQGNIYLWEYTFVVGTDIELNSDKGLFIVARKSKIEIITVFQFVLSHKTYFCDDICDPKINYNLVSP
jgi:hypothetical protein